MKFLIFNISYISFFLLNLVPKVMILGQFHTFIKLYVKTVVNLWRGANMDDDWAPRVNLGPTWILKFLKFKIKWRVEIMEFLASYLRIEGDSPSVVVSNSTPGFDLCVNMLRAARSSLPKLSFKLARNLVFLIFNF